MLAAASLLADIRRPQGIIVPVSRRLTPGLARERKGWSGHRGSVTSYEPDLVVQCDRMHVPSDSFNGRSPEKHAALMLENLFTFAACKVAMAQVRDVFDPLARLTAHPNVRSVSRCKATVGGTSAVLVGTNTSR